MEKDFETVYGIEFYSSFTPYLAFYTYNLLMDIIKEQNPNFNPQEHTNKVIALWSEGVQEYIADMANEYNEVLTGDEDTGGDSPAGGDGGEAVDTEDYQQLANESLIEAREKVVEQLKF